MHLLTVVYTTGALCFKVFLCSLSSYFFILFSIVITSLGEERAGLCASRAFVLYVLFFVIFLFLLVSGVGCGLWLWHSLNFSINVFGIFAICHKQICRDFAIDSWASVSSKFREYSLVRDVCQQQISRLSGIYRWLSPASSKTKSILDMEKISRLLQTQAKPHFWTYRSPIFGFAFIYFKRICFI